MPIIGAPPPAAPPQTQSQVDAAQLKRDQDALAAAQGHAQGNPVTDMQNTISKIPVIGGILGTSSNPALDTLSNEDKINWRITADQAQQALGTKYGAPTAKAPTWQQAPVATFGAAQAAASPQAQAASVLGSQLNDQQINQTRQAQGQLAASLQGTAAGQGPSVAQSQLQQATAQNINNQAAQAQSIHGAGRLAALRSAGMAGAATQQTAAAQASGLRAQEIAAAQGNLGSVLGQVGGQDIATANQNAQLQQQAQLATSGYQQQAALLNPQLQQQVNLQNAQLQQQAQATNAGATNTAANNFSQQQNAGNLSLAGQNLSAQLGTNALNEQQAMGLVQSQQNMAGALTDIDKTRLTNQNVANAQQWGQTKDVLGLAGGLLNSGGQASAATALMGV